MVNRLLDFMNENFKLNLLQYLFPHSHHAAPVFLNQDNNLIHTYIALIFYKTFNFTGKLSSFDH